MEVDVFWFVILPLSAALAGAVYMARRDFLQRCDHEERLRQVEVVLAVHANTEPEASPDIFSAVLDMGGVVTVNSQTLRVHEERIEALEIGSE